MYVLGLLLYIILFMPCTFIIIIIIVIIVIIIAIEMKNKLILFSKTQKD